MATLLSRKGGGSSGGGGGGAPSGPAGGDLGGTYPNPSIANDVVDASKIDGADAAAIRTELDVPSNAEAVLDSLFDANTVLAANADDTPAAVTMAASTILARLAAGNIKAASVAEIITLLAAYTVGGTDVAVTDGGTGSSTAGGALTNLGVSAFVQTLLDDTTAAAALATLGGLPIRSPLAPTAAIAETFPRRIGTLTEQYILTSQQLNLQAIYLPTGLLVTSITFASGSQALVTGVNQVAGLYDSALALLRSSTDATNTAWAANTLKTFTLTSTFTTTYSGLHYIGLLVNATTAPQIVCIPNAGNGGLAITGAAPKLHGTSTGSVTALPANAAAITSQIVGAYAYLS